MLYNPSRGPTLYVNTNLDLIVVILGNSKFEDVFLRVEKSNHIFVSAHADVLLANYILLAL
jgi:hypothetical protein